jgi:hypothetical protein
MIEVRDHDDHDDLYDVITSAERRVDIAVDDNIGSSFNKCGSFEWIISSFEEINKYLDVKYIGIDMNTMIDTKLLVIGCGTSELSENIVKRYELCSVVSIDNDRDCINYMKMKTMMMMKPCIHGSSCCCEKGCSCYHRLAWYVYDLIEDSHCSNGGYPNNKNGHHHHRHDRHHHHNNTHYTNHNDHIDVDNYNKKCNELDEDNYFNIIIDKGTLDAILVEGSIYMMLVEVYRMLRIDGIYLLISINTRRLLEPILMMKPLRFELIFYEDIENHCTIVICKKRGDSNDDDSNDNASNADSNDDSSNDDASIDDSNDDGSNDDGSNDDNDLNHCGPRDDHDQSSCNNDNNNDCSSYYMNEESAILNNYFQNECPLVTKKLEASLKLEFYERYLANYKHDDDNSDDNQSHGINSLPAVVNIKGPTEDDDDDDDDMIVMSIMQPIHVSLHDAYEIMFIMNNKELTDYTFDLFIEDLQSIYPSCVNGHHHHHHHHHHNDNKHYHNGVISYEQAMVFLRTMQ